MRRPLAALKTSLLRHLRNMIAPRNHVEKRRNRRLFLEQFEDRRLLATAYDDGPYSVHTNSTLTVTGLGLMANDIFNYASWRTQQGDCTISHDPKRTWAR